MQGPEKTIHYTRNRILEIYIKDFATSPNPFIVNNYILVVIFIRLFVQGHECPVLTYDESCKKGSLQSLLAPASTSSHYTAGAFLYSPY